MTISMETTADRPMRRRNRCLARQEALEILLATEHAVLSTTDAAGVPYGVPVSPVYLEGKLYFHCLSLPGGRRSDNLLANPRVSVCFIKKQDTLPDHFSVDYESVIVSGRAYPVTDAQEWERALIALCRRHCPEQPMHSVLAEIRKHAKATAVWRIEIDSMSGKSRAGSRERAGKKA